MPVSGAILEVAAQTGIAMLVHCGDVLRIIDPHGEQVADLALFSAGDLSEVFSPGRTMDYNESIRLSRGASLYSNKSAELARVVEDSVGVHDMLLAPCSAAMFARRGELAHASCHANLTAALLQFGVSNDMVTTTLNVFMDVRVGADGRITLHPPASKADDSFAIVALRELVVGVSACASEKTNNGVCKPIGVELHRSDRTTPQEPRIVSPVATTPRDETE